MKVVFHVIHHFTALPSDVFFAHVESGLLKWDLKSLKITV